MARYLGADGRGRNAEEELALLANASILVLLVFLVSQRSFVESIAATVVRG